MFSCPVQGCGSGSAGSALISIAGSGSRRAKITYKYRKKVQNFYVLKCWMFFFEG
jgi:hypothetical protein